VIVKCFRNEKLFFCYFGIPGLKGIVLETYGAGNANTEDWFIALLVKAINKGLHVINVTQCSGGSVNMGQYETTRHESDRGHFRKGIQTEAAITKLMYLLCKTVQKTLKLV
jgi:L-asparaginase